MWHHDAYSCDTVGADLPLTAPGIAVQHRWPRVSKAEGITSPRKAHQTHTSSDAPSFLATTILNGVFPRAAPELPPEGFLLHDARRRRVQQDPRYRARVDDTAVSIDAPEWVASTLREHKLPQDALCAPVARYRVGAANRVVFSPLVEVDPFGVRPPRALPKPFAGPGYVPTPEERARVEAHYAATGRERMGKTMAGEIGSGAEGGGLLSRPAEKTTAPPRPRFGATAAAAIGDTRAAAVLADTLRSEEEAAPPLTLPNGAAFRAEPPFANYFTHRRAAQGLPGLADTALHAHWGGLGPEEHRAGRVQDTVHHAHSSVTEASGGESARARAGPTGHALFRALTNAHGEKTGGHLALARVIAAETAGEASLRGTQRADFAPNFKSGPLHCALPPQPHGASRAQSSHTHTYCTHPSPTYPPFFFHSQGTIQCGRFRSGLRSSVYAAFVFRFG